MYISLIYLILNIPICIYSNITFHAENNHCKKSSWHATPTPKLVGGGGLKMFGKKFVGEGQTILIWKGRVVLWGNQRILGKIWKLHNHNIKNNYSNLLSMGQYAIRSWLGDITITQIYTMLNLQFFFIFQALQILLPF